MTTTAPTRALTATVLDPRRDPEPPGWEGFRVRHGLPAPWDYRLLGIESAHSPSPILLTLLHSGGELVAAFGCMVVRPVRLGPTLADTQFPWLSGVPSWVFDDGLDAADRLAARRVYERAITRRLGAFCAGVVYRNVAPDGVGLLAGRGRLAKETLGTSVLDNTFPDFEGWLRGLTKSRRSSVRGQIKKVAADPDLVARTEGERDDLDGEVLADLLRRHRARLGEPRFDWRGGVSGAYLHELVRRSDVATTTYHDTAGTLLAFATALDSPSLVFHQHWAALPPEEGGRKHLYYEGFTRVVRYALERGRPAVTAGRGMAEVKAQLGFTYRPLHTVAAPRPVCR
ncbi:GNAT family N-acetyltransferase [Actinokineospora sp. PR83]|uniref:GNAT family N-acetyltransferase n=1 Tax=Actinokineospora sp. PR83 TaxID=2884908 RepID=UPI001F15F2BB|nr:GNAT family N-acetyltransferase [Actinokineospora sp. PR83]MCG8915652.1 GNAT family N-acetyltransferase [Actinokineospora sp. PR83]